MLTALIIIHVIICVALVVIVLMQQGKQQGLSGAIAGGAETFFGKNKAKTMDGMLKKVTVVIAALFIISSIVLAVVSINVQKKADAADAAAQQQVEEQVQTDAVDEEVVAPVYTLNEEGALVDETGKVVADADALKNEDNFNENGDLINPATGDILVTAAELEAATGAQE